MRFTVASMTLGFAALAAAQLPAIPIVEAIAPNARSCSDPECRTAAQAAPFIAQAMFDHGIFSVNQMAAIISLMAFESADFAFKRNAFPGRPGQGTANMQMPNFNLKYAKSIDSVRDKVAAIDSVEGLSDQELNNILELVIPDETNFGSGPWFLVNECDPSVRAALDADVDSGFQEYMACVGVEVTEDRLAYLTRAKTAFNIN
ncbi:hypothetical protein B0I35DRAFT_458885 [Stachybotrys elegans]|uniref:Heme haloperoxidase family profile domain-containing protein n=1 Tax=Stachybotrys elegans TaxID=80388 RepID=A0A8K0T0S0_9HYPO|nr:hypothetical protein B0I35DRAFT_458885 [Stachybotrys elegans]